MTNPYELLPVDLIKSTPVKLIELYQHREYDRGLYQEDLRNIYVVPDRGYVRLYLSDGEVIQLKIPRIEYCLIQDDVLYDHIKETGRLPRTTLPDILYYTNSVRQTIGYLVHKDCRVTTQISPTEINRSFAAHSARR